MLRASAAALICGLLSCASPDAGEVWVTIGVVDDSPDLYTLLDEADIFHAEDGSIIYSLLVPAKDAERATQLLLEHRVGKSFWWFRTSKEAKAHFQTPLDRRPGTSDPSGRLIHGDYVTSVAYAGPTLATATYDGLLTLWNSKSESMSRFQADAHKLNAVAFSPDGRRLASGGDDGRVRVWNLETAERVEGAHQAAINEVAFDPRGGRVASAGRDKTVRIWDAATGRALFTLDHADEVFAVAYAPDGRTLATGGREEAVRIWDAATGAPMAAWSFAPEGDVHTLAFSPDGRSLALGLYDPFLKRAEHWTVRVWDAATGREALRLQGPGRWAAAVAFSPDGRFLAAGGENGALFLWELPSGMLRGRLTGHQDVVESIAFAPDGLRLASGARDAAVRLWDVAPLMR